MDTLQHWSDTTGQPISLVASCYALEQLKSVSNQHNDVGDGNLLTAAQQKVCEPRKRKLLGVPTNYGILSTVANYY